MVVFGVLLEVWGELVDACGKQRNLYFGAACISSTTGVIFDNGGFIDHDWFPEKYLTCVAGRTTRNVRNAPKKRSL